MQSTVPMGNQTISHVSAGEEMARYASSFEVGSHVEVYGRIQSREYIKKIGEEQTEKRVAYEVSVNKIEFLE